MLIDDGREKLVNIGNFEISCILLDWTSMHSGRYRSSVEYDKRLQNCPRLVVISLCVDWSFVDWRCVDWRWVDWRFSMSISWLKMRWLKSPRFMDAFPFMREECYIYEFCTLSVASIKLKTNLGSNGVIYTSKHYRIEEHSPFVSGCTLTAMD